MEFQQLRYFIEVAKIENFTTAAQRCHVTQPTLSHQIKKLEEELGERLFQRNNRMVRLTEFGKRLYPKAADILEGIRQMHEEANAFHKTIQVLYASAPSRPSLHTTSHASFANPTINILNSTLKLPKTPQCVSSTP